MLVLPYYKLKNAELRLNLIMDDDLTKWVYEIEVRYPSVIPFVKWSKWKLFSPDTTFKTVDLALDAILIIKGIIETNKSKNLKKPKIEWKEIK